MHANNTTQNNKPRGQSLVEFALLLPVLLLLILGAMDFARLFTTKIVLTNAAREGANYLTRNPHDFAGAYAAIDFEAQNLILDDKDITCSSFVEGVCAQGSTVTAIVTKNMSLIFTGFFQFMGVDSGPFSLSSKVEMMVR